MITKIQTVQEMSAYVRERMFICTQIEIWIQDRKSPAEIVGKFLADGKDDMEVSPVTLLRWLERCYPHAWPKPSQVEL